MKDQGLYKQIDMANICELAHELTARECKIKNIPCEEENISTPKKECIKYYFKVDKFYFIAIKKFPLSPTQWTA